MDLLKFIICGNVDDGKSTLTGRLLYDTGNIFEDQFADHQNKTTGETDLARVTDGLRAERERGITIDVAYKYFSTPRRKFICIDAPGHKEYTRNMVSGASQADVAILLIDAKHGITEQTLRHARVCRFLKLQHIIVAINKMDAVDYLEEIFHSISSALTDLAGPDKHMHFIPLSGLTGNNVTMASSQLLWYKGPTLLELLETITLNGSPAENHKIIVQQAIPNNGTQFIFAYSQPDIVPGHLIHTNSGSEIAIDIAHSGGNNYCFTYTGQLNINRGDVFVQKGTVMHPKNNLGIELFNLSDTPLRSNTPYLFFAQNKLQQATFISETIIAENEFGLAMLDLESPLYLLEHETLRGILIDPHTKKTIAAVNSLYSSK